MSEECLRLRDLNKRFQSSSGVSIPSFEHFQNVHHMDIAFFIQHVHGQTQFSCAIHNLIAEYGHPDQKQMHSFLITVENRAGNVEPRLLIVVVLDRFRSKFHDFCDVCRRHITAPLPCANFVCVVTRSTTAEF